MHTQAFKTATLALLSAAISCRVAAQPSNLTAILSQLQHQDVATVSSKLRDLQVFLCLEEHWVTPVLENITISNPVSQLSRGIEDPQIPKHIVDAGVLRLTNMTDNGIRKQVLSAGATPAAMDDPTGCRTANEQMAAAVKNHAGRFDAFAILPMSYPDQAAAELERAVKRFGFLGALIDNHLPNGTHYDGPEYRVFWSKVQELEVPIYIHPTFPSLDAVTAGGVGTYAPIGGDFTDPVAALLGTSAWGWHQSTGLHFLRLYSAGIFVQFPKLKIVLGHMGEMIPFFLERANEYLAPANPGKPSVIDTYHTNIWITTAGIFSVNPMATILRNTAIDRIMYSVDYPFGNSMDGLRFMIDLLRSDLVTAEEWENIAFRNAQVLLGVS